MIVSLKKRLILNTPREIVYSNIYLLDRIRQKYYIIMIYHLGMLRK